MVVCTCVSTCMYRRVRLSEGKQNRRRIRTFTHLFHTIQLLNQAELYGQGRFITVSDMRDHCYATWLAYLFQTALLNLCIEHMLWTHCLDFWKYIIQIQYRRQEISVIFLPVCTCRSATARYADYSYLQKQNCHSEGCSTACALKDFFTKCNETEQD